VANGSDDVAGQVDGVGKKVERRARTLATACQPQAVAGHIRTVLGAGVENGWDLENSKYLRVL
jgi:hypothetical protein